jgi:8-oxo-dGTP pyrophosphatase MutT (NUDIX family)
MFKEFTTTIKQFLGLKKGLTHYADCIIRNEKGQLLFLERSAQSKIEPSKWCLPGGHLDPGEMPEYAAARELLEETNLQTPLQFIESEERADSVSFYFEGYVLSSQPIILDNNEHYRYQWVEVEDIAKYDLLFDLKHILMHKIGLPIYSTKLMELDLVDANDLFKRVELVEKSFDADQMTVEEFFKCKELAKTHAATIIIQAQEQNELEKGGKRAFIGEKREFAGRMHIKTIDGWKYFGDGLGKKAKEHSISSPTVKAARAVVYPTKSTESTTKSSLPEISDLDFSSKVGAGGSGRAYIISDSTGKKYVIKEAQEYGDKNTLEQLKNEQLADSIYAAMGVANSGGELKKDASGTTFKIAPFIEKSKELGSLSTSSDEYKTAKKILQKNFVLDCLLLNWDVIGAGKDNVVVTGLGMPHRIDNGGSLLYRAKNGLKSEASLTETVSEIDVMRSSKNPSAKEIFGDIADDEIFKQVEEIVAKRDDILQAIMESESSSKSKLHSLIAKRIDSLESKYVKGERTSIEPTIAEIEKERLRPGSTTDKWKEKMIEGETIVGHRGIAHGIIEHVEEVEKINEKYYKQYADRRGISIEEYKSKLQDKIERIANSVSLFRATDIEILDIVLNVSKRFKSQFETSTSHGSLSPESRSRAEANYFGFPKSASMNKEMRPIYGYCSTNIHGVQNSSGSHPPANSASHYGGVTIKIKDEVKKQATFTFGDSLGSDGSRAATPLLAPHFTSFKAHSDPLDLSEDISKYSGDYVEVQFHNQLTVNEIESVELSPLNVSSSSSGEGLTKKQLEYINKVIEVTRKTHLKIEIYGDK